MSDKRSAGLLVFRRTTDGGVEVLIGHMGGPFWASREQAAWSIPKGEYEPDEAPEAAASREFLEELGLPAPEGAWLDLGEARQRNGKLVTVWAVEGTLDPAGIVPGTFTMEWPPRSGVQGSSRRSTGWAGSPRRRPRRCSSRGSGSSWNGWRNSSAEAAEADCQTRRRGW